MQESSVFDYEGNTDGVSRGIRYDVALHALLLSLPGIPVLRSGDEIGQLNDYTYKADPSRASDPRWLHNGHFNWILARNRADAETIQGRIFNSLEQLESIRASHPVFAPEIPAHTLETWEKSLLALVRETSEEKLICIYNFSDQDKVAWINETGRHLYRSPHRSSKRCTGRRDPGLWIYLAHAYEIVSSSSGYA